MYFEGLMTEMVINKYCANILLASLVFAYPSNCYIEYKYDNLPTYMFVSLQ